MKIECLIRRKKGTIVEFKADNAAYHFVPDEEGRHVADVDNDKHAKRLLNIEPEAYIKLGEEPKSARYLKKRGKKVDFESESIDLDELNSGTEGTEGEGSGDSGTENKGSGQADPSEGTGTDDGNGSGEINPDDMSSLIDDDDDDDSDLTPGVVQGEGGSEGNGTNTPEDGNQEPGNEPDATNEGDGSTSENKDDADGEDDGKEELDRDALAKKYEEKFGKAPHHKAKAETILEKLNESQG